MLRDNRIANNQPKSAPFYISCVQHNTCMAKCNPRFYSYMARARECLIRPTSPRWVAIKTASKQHIFPADLEDNPSLLRRVERTHKSSSLHGSSAMEGICNKHNIYLHDEISHILLAEQESQTVQQDN
jgi:hypothetical protein